jgi:hypothetical protein
VGVLVVAGEARLGFLERQLRQQGDAVEGLLAVGNDVVAERLDLEPGKGVVDAFDFLQADDVRRALREPAHQMLDPLSDGIDVPRSNTHKNDPDRNHTFSLRWHTMSRKPVVTV